MFMTPEEAIHDFSALKMGYEKDGIYPVCFDYAIDLCKKEIERRQKLEDMVNTLAEEHGE